MTTLGGVLFAWTLIGLGVRVYIGHSRPAAAIGDTWLDIAIDAVLWPLLFFVFPKGSS